MCQDFHSREERSSVTLHTAKTAGDVQPVSRRWQREGGSVDGKLLKGDISLTESTGLLLKTGQNDQLSKVRDEEFD